VRYLLPLWLILITALSLAPVEVKDRLGTTGALHTYGHVVVFLITTVLACLGTADTWTRFARAGAIAVFAMLCEWMEFAVYGNFYFEWRDVRVDWIGIALGLAISAAAQRILEARRRLALKSQSVATPGVPC
jgi:hypothetical protein